MTAESPSFKRYEQKGLSVNTQEFVTVDVQLEVGNVSQSVTVTEEAPLVDNSNASQGQLLDRQQLVDLPNLRAEPVHAVESSAERDARWKSCL